jgi:hypothetical protein
MEAKKTLKMKLLVSPAIKIMGRGGFTYQERGSSTSNCRKSQQKENRLKRPRETGKSGERRKTALKELGVAQPPETNHATVIDCKPEINIWLLWCNFIPQINNLGVFLRCSHMRRRKDK